MVWSSIAACEKITVSRLLKSWATPPARRPTLSIFCAWVSSASRRFCAVTSVAMPAMR